MYICNHNHPSSFPHATNFLSILFSPLLSHLQRHTLLSLPPSRAFTVLSLLFVQSFHYITRALGFCLVCFFIIYSTCRACPRFTKKKNWLDKSDLRARPGGQGCAYNHSRKKKEGRAQIRRLCGTLLQQSFVCLMWFENKIGGAAQTWV